MSGTTLRIIIAGVFFVHGVGHILGFFPAFRLTKMDNWTSRSWLLTPLLGETIATIISVILFGAALLGFVGAGLSIMSWLIPHDLWRTLAIVSSVISLSAVILFWNAFPALIPNKAGALAVDIATLVCLLWLNWPTGPGIGY